MLAFFPTLLRDELLYSALARYHNMSTNTSFKNSLHDWFGSQMVSATPDLPGHLERVSTASGNVYSPDELIMRHTTFPYYNFFLSTGRTRQVIEAMTNDGPNTVHTRIGLRHADVANPAYFRYCVFCTQGDIRTTGTAYWHRVHQLPGVLVCPIHKVGLSVSRARFSTLNNRRSFQLPIQAQDLVETHTFESNNGHLLHLADEARWLLENGARKAISTGTIREFYLNRLNDFGLLTNSGRVRQSEVQHELKRFYQTTSAINDLFVNHETWVPRLLRKHDTYIHPLRHILFLHFLGSSVEELDCHALNTASYAQLQEGHSVYMLCLNKAADHYHVSVPLQVYRKTSKHTGKSIETYTCACGYVFTKGVHMNGEPFLKVVTHGAVWERRVSELKHAGLSLRKIAEQVGSSPTTISKYLRETEQEDSLIEPTNHYRQLWLFTLQEYPTYSRNQLRTTNPAVYAWLYRHDKEWLIRSLPQRLPSTIHRKKRNWKLTDIDLRDRIILAAHEIKQIKPPVIITKTKIGNQIGERYLIDKHLGNLPLCRRTLELYCESNEDFHFRYKEYRQSLLSPSDFAADSEITYDVGLGDSLYIDSNSINDFEGLSP